MEKQASSVHLLTDERRFSGIFPPGPYSWKNLASSGLKLSYFGQNMTIFFLQDANGADGGSIWGSAMQDSGPVEFVLFFPWPNNLLVCPKKLAKKKYWRKCAEQTGEVAEDGQRRIHRRLEGMRPCTNLPRSSSHSFTDAWKWEISQTSGSAGIILEELCAQVWDFLWHDKYNAKFYSF